MGPPQRKNSLPKHSEVKKKFLEICDTALSDEVKAALRLPAFDSYEWEDADVLHLMQTMFLELGLVSHFNLPVGTLREWLYEVYKHYNDVPFHNFRHCFCVAQMVSDLTSPMSFLTWEWEGEEKKGCFTEGKLVWCTLLVAFYEFYIFFSFFLWDLSFMKCQLFHLSPSVNLST